MDNKRSNSINKYDALFQNIHNETEAGFLMCSMADKIPKEDREDLLAAANRAQDRIYNETVAAGLM